MRRALSTVLVLMAATFGWFACATQEVSPAPDAAVQPCNPGPFPFGCTPTTPDQPGCNSEDGTSALLTQLPRATRYPVNCTFNFVGPRDEGGNCRADVCKCLIADVTTAPITDAGADATARPAPPPVTTTRPIWNCSVP